MTKYARLVALILMCADVTHVVAQQARKKKAAAKTNVVIISDATDTLGSSPDGPRYFMFPQFYSYWPITKGDTIIKYLCYDKDDNGINVDTLHNIDDVQHISFVKVYTNYLHTYIDPEGKPRPSLASKIIYRYDKTGDDSWTSTDYGSNYISELKEHKNEIVRTDTTTVVNPITSTKQLTIRKYYKIEELKKKGEIEQEK
jgi:hypothetical protein